MDGIDDTRCPTAQQRPMGGAQVSSTRGSLPIMQMKDVWRQPQQRQRFQQSPAKKQKPPLLIALIEAKIEALMPPKELRVIKQVHRDRGIRESSSPDRHRLVCPAQR